jgi:hypothetical protein
MGKQGVKLLPVTAFNWQEFLATFGGQTALLAAVAYLIKTLVSSRLEKDAEAFKADLKRNSDIEIERLKNALQMTALEHQVRFSKLHERRAEVIGELSQGIQAARSAVTNLVRNPGDAEQLEATQTLTSDLLMCIRENQVIFPRDLVKRLDRYSERLYAMAAVFGISWKLWFVGNEIPTPEKKAIQDKMLADASSALEGEIADLQNKLIEDLRELLAGSSD